MRIIGDAINKREGIIGSNEWGVSGSNTVSGRPMIANDPHLSLDQPATFYQNHLIATADGMASWASPPKASHAARHRAGRRDLARRAG